VPEGTGTGTGTGTTATFTFTVTRTGYLDQASTASWAAAGSGASPATASDFAGGALPTGTVSFAAGQTSQTITVNVAGDSTVEPDEGFTVTLSAPSPGLTLGTAVALGTIQNDDTSLAISATSAVVAEANSGSTAYTFTVTRSGDVAGTSTVDFAVAGSGIRPANAADFAGGSLPVGTVTFLPGATSQNIAINVAGDTVVETHETFEVRLSNASADAQIATAAAQGTIIADDTIVDLAVIDGSTRQPVFLTPSFYNGPVTGIEKELIRNTSENFVISAGGPNWFIRTGSGDDAIAVISGTNVLDGGTGSNFLTGGSGPDSFFVDARNMTAPIWSTLVDFNPGDAATMWGISTGAFDLIWLDTQGAEDFKGLTVHAMAPGLPVASLTLAGFSQTDVDAGRLSVQFGFEPVSASNYMYVYHH